MLIFVKMQNWIKWQTDTCFSVQNTQKIRRAASPAEIYEFKI